MHAVLNRFSQENMKCFLDIQDKENVDYYKRFGFKLIKECQYADLDVPFWGMFWEPENLQLFNIYISYIFYATFQNIYFFEL